MNPFVVFVPALLFSTMATAALPAKARLAGSWTLVRWEAQNEKGEWKPRCPSPVRRIVYSPEGSMSVGINCMKAEGSKEPSYDSANSVFYAGTYRQTANSVVHQITSSSDPIFFGKELRRDLRFEIDGTVTLTGPGKNGHPIRVVWKREISGTTLNEVNCLDRAVQKKYPLVCKAVVDPLKMARGERYELDCTSQLEDGYAAGRCEVVDLDQQREFRLRK